MAEAQFFDRYQAKWKEHYNVPCSLILSPLDYGKLGIHLKELTPAQLEQCLDGYFETDDYLVLKRRHPLGLFLVQPTRYMPVETKRRYVTPCPHAPRCKSTGACCHQQDMER